MSEEKQELLKFQQTVSQVLQRLDEKEKKEAEQKAKPTEEEAYDASIEKILGSKPRLEFNPERAEKMKMSIEDQISGDISSQGDKAVRQDNAQKAKRIVELEHELETKQEELEGVDESLSDVSRAVARKIQSWNKVHDIVTGDTFGPVSRKTVFKITSIIVALILLVVAYEYANNPNFQIQVATIIHNQVDLGMIIGAAFLYFYVWVRYVRNSP